MARRRRGWLAPAPSRKAPIPPEVKAAVIRRDGTRCLKCNVQTTKHLDGVVRNDTIAFDHIRPESKGGPTTVGNIQVLCTKCNRWKGVRRIDYRRRRVVQSVEQKYVADCARRGVEPRPEGLAAWRMGYEDLRQGQLRQAERRAAVVAANEAIDRRVEAEVEQIRAEARARRMTTV